MHCPLFPEELDHRCVCAHLLPSQSPLASRSPRAAATTRPPTAPTAPSAPAPPTTAASRAPRASGAEPAAAGRRVAAPRSSPARRSPTTDAPPSEAAGTITYLTGFDFAGTASIVDVIVADANGYYDHDVPRRRDPTELLDGQLPARHRDDAQFASGGSFSEVVAFAAADVADFVVTAVEGPTTIVSPILEPGVAAARRPRRLDDRGQGQASSQRHGDARHRRASWRTATSRRCCSTDSISDGPRRDRVDRRIPGYKSNEPGALSAPGSSSTCSIRSTTTSPARSA